MIHQIKKEPGKAPEGFLHFLWMLKNWRTYWRELIGFALFPLLLWGLASAGTHAIDFIRSRFSSVTMRVIHFDHSTGTTTLEFNNKTLMSVPVEHVYVAVGPTNTVPMNPLPPDIQRLKSMLDTSTLLVPSGACLELGPLSSDVKPKGRRVRLAVLLVHETPPLVLPPGITVTNVAPNGTAFADVCNRFAEGAELEVMLHTSLTDTAGRLRTQNVSLGKYVVGHKYTKLDNIPNPRDVDVLRGAKVGGNSCRRMVFTVSGGMELPALDDKVQSSLLENRSPNDMLVTLGERIEGLVPTMLIKKSILYGCVFDVELQEGEAVPRDFSAWVLSCDGGKTVMTVPMAFSNNWAAVQSTPSLGKIYTVPLSSNDWHLLVKGERWARIADGSINYTVTEKAWLKLLNPHDVTASFLDSNYNMIARQEVKDDTSWVLATNTPVVPTNSKTLLIVQNEAVPDLSMFSTLRFPDSLSTNSSSSVLSPSQVSDKATATSDTTKK